MTTIAYKDGVIACDSRLSNGSEYQEGVRKIGRTDRFLFGYAGRLGGMRPAFDWVLDIEHDIEDTGDLYKHADDLFIDDSEGTILLADYAGSVWTMSGGVYMTEHPRGWESMGSGGTYACGAMMHGASAVEAIEVAVKLDVYSGGDIHQLKLTSIRDNDIERPGLIRS